MVWRTNYYVVTGTNWVDIRHSLEKARPWTGSFDGKTSWEVTWRFSTVGSGDGCRCTGLTTGTRITTTLPQWNAPLEARQRTRQNWTNFMDRLASHEAGHARIALSAAAEIRLRFGETNAIIDCGTLRKVINEGANRVVQEHRTREQEYDRDTLHGAVITPGASTDRK